MKNDKKMSEVGQNDNLTPLGIKGISAKIFRLSIFANPVFSHSFNFGGGLGPFSAWGVCLPLFGFGDCDRHV